MEVIETFKDAIFKTTLNEDLNKLIQFSKKIEKQKGRKLSNYGGFQSEDLNINESCLSNLIKEIILKSNLFYKEIFNISKNLSISNIWLNINYYKDFNTVHYHSYSSISGVFYIKTPKNCGDLIFLRDAPVESFIESKFINKYNNYNASQWSLPAIKNTLYLFPSWSKHFVSSNMSKEKRISLSFNLI